MKPILIDSRVLKKLGVVAALCLLLVFIGGFLLGYQYAATARNADSENGMLTTFLGNDDSTETAEQQAVTADAVEKDEDQPEEHVIAEAPVEKTAKIAPEKIQPVIKPKASAVQVTSTPTKDATPQIKTTDKPKTIRYSIQVGTFNKLIYAQKMKRKLQEQNIDAYVSSYTKNNKIRFNVRFGRFEYRNSAKSALQDYKMDQQGDGYLVNFSEKNIIHSDADDYEQAVKEAAPVTTPINKVQPDTATAVVPAPDNLPQSQETAR